MKKSYRSAASRILYFLAFVLTLVSGLLLLNSHYGTPASAPGAIRIPSQETAETPDEIKPAIDTYSVAADVPKYLTIPSLSVKARIVSLGVSADDRLLSPTNIHDVGWYDKSAKPASKTGAIVLDGHVSGPTQNGVFYDLKKLRAGDTIILTAGNDTTTTFIVRTTEKLNVADVDMNKVLAPVSSKLGLNMITCTGSFNKDTNQYEERFIVYAEAAK